jgi:hypothetical protein
VTLTDLGLTGVKQTILGRGPDFSLRRHWFSSIVLLAGVIVMPDGPWWREVACLLLILIGAEKYEFEKMDTQ